MENQGHARNTLSRVLNESAEKLKSYEEAMALFEDEPLILMSDILHDGDPLLLNVLFNDGEDSLLETQTYWFQYLIPRLSDYLGTEEFVLKYNKSTFPSLIHVTLNEETVATIDIYNHLFNKVEPPEISEWQEKRPKLVKKHNELADKIENLFLMKENPLVVGGANPIELMKISVNKEKYVQKIEEEIEDTEYKMNLIETEVRGGDDQIEALQYNRLLVDEHLMKILRRLSTIKGYEYIKQTLSQVEGTEMEEYTSDVSSINENRTFQRSEPVSGPQDEEFMFQLED